MAGRQLLEAMKKLQGAMKKAWRLVADNPRRSIHSVKVGLALAITSATVLEKRLYGLLGDNAIWSVMSVVVVFELTAGATIYKGSNRAIGTMLAGMIALSIEYLADLTGPTGEPYAVGVSILVIGVISTFTRFCEPFKSNFDYGVMIFLLTYSLIIVSSYRVANYHHLAVSRFLNILLGGTVALATNILIKPVWASEDLHNTIWTNFFNLAQALEGITNTYVKEGERQYQESLEDDPVFGSYNAVLSSKHNEETLANYANWEPRWRSKKGVWKQYVKVGGVLRHCAYTVASLHGCLIPNSQAPYVSTSPFLVMCGKVAMECATLLNKIGESIQKKEMSETKEVLLIALSIEVKNLNNVVGSVGGSSFANEKPSFVPSATTTEEEKDDGERGDSAQILNGSFDGGEISHDMLAMAAVAYFLIELVSRLRSLVDSVELLEKLASFKISKDKNESLSISMVHKASFDSVTIQTTD